MKSTVRGTDRGTPKINEWKIIHMKLKDFIKTIKEAGNITDSQEVIAIELFSYSGICATESTVNAWVKEKKKPKHEKGSVNEAGFIKYFKERTRSTWKNIQGEFGRLDEYGIIDCDTENEDEFYQSLLNLFYELLRIPWSKETVSEKMLEIFAKAIRDCRIKELIESDPTVLLNDCLPDEADRFIKIIKDDIMIPFSKNEDKIMYQKIGEFTEVLYEYNNYLPKNMRLIIGKKNITLVPLYRDENPKWAMQFEKETRDYRQKIIDKYSEIYKAETK